MLFDIIQNNYACIIVSFLFIVFVITDKSFDSRIDAFFLIAILVPLLLTVIDNLELLEAQLAEPTFARRLYSALGYSLRPLSAIMMILIVGRDLRIKKSGKILSAVLAIPFFFNLIISFVSIFNGCVFNYNTNNHFFRGVFGLVPLFVSIFYVLCMVICSIVFLNTKRRSEILIIIVVAALCIIGSLMETNFQIDGSLNTACAIGTVFYYLYLHVSVYSTDQLTHVYNRRIFYLDIRRCKKKAFT